MLRPSIALSAGLTTLFAVRPCPSARSGALPRAYRGRSTAGLQGRVRDLDPQEAVSGCRERVGHLRDSPSAAWPAAAWHSNIGSRSSRRGSNGNVIGAVVPRLLPGSWLMVNEVLSPGCVTDAHPVEHSAHRTVQRAEAGSLARMRKPSEILRKMSYQVRSPSVRRRRAWTACGGVASGCLAVMARLDLRPS